MAIKPTAGEKVRAFYEESADSYDSMMDAEIELPMYTTALGGLAQRIAAFDGAVLDSSCGSGHMLEKLKDQYTPGRQFIGVDLSPRMVAIAQKRLGRTATIVEGDMAALVHVQDASCAAVLSYFALHHVDLESMQSCFAAWHRVLKTGGQLLVATWEGEGTIDYGDQTNMVACRYRPEQIAQAAHTTDFSIDSNCVEEVEGMEMDAVYLTATKR
ncbi:MAG: methyltransferase domain-containing protein [Candidatus Latescibacteria bacterium]|nr:methyltransferase domain-containing protein [Candidatus Latescibacterota bacterium]